MEGASNSAGREKCIKNQQYGKNIYIYLQKHGAILDQHT